MKSTGTIENGDGLWYSPNEQATNESGFSGFPGGVLNIDGSYNLVGGLGSWWSSTEFDSYGISIRELVSNDSSAGRYYVYTKQDGFSVRCVRD
jgi:uncharacterized protein (TIGR02145 family)